MPGLAQAVQFVGALVLIGAGAGLIYDLVRG
jgi:hypothetical protein